MPQSGDEPAAGHAVPKPDRKLRPAVRGITPRDTGRQRAGERDSNGVTEPRPAVHAKIASGRITSNSSALRAM